MKFASFLAMGIAGFWISMAGASEPSPRIEAAIGAPDGRPADQRAIDQVLKLVSARVARGEVTQLQSDYGIEGDLYLCVGFDWSTSDPTKTEPVRKALLKELQAVPVAPGNEKSVAVVGKCTLPQ
jgi:hypothetical protein